MWSILGHSVGPLYRVQGKKWQTTHRSGKYNTEAVDMIPNKESTCQIKSTHAS